MCWPIRCLLLLSALQLGALRAYPCSADEPNRALNFADTLEAVFECVLDNHIEPPTRQQMVLAVLRRLHYLDSPAQLAALSRMVSEVESKEALYELMRQEIARHASQWTLEPERMRWEDMAWLKSTIPGGIQLDVQKNIEVAKQLAANRYVGIGVQLSKANEDFVFGRIMENGTAARGGILSGDHLLKVNGVPVDGDMEHVIDQLRGPEGSTVRVTVRTNNDEPRDIELRRQVVVMKTMKLEPLEPDDTTAIIAVENIKASAAHELQTLIEQLPDTVDEVKIRLEFDGNFHYFHLFADALLDEGPLGCLVTREGRRLVKTEDGNVLGGRTLKIELTDRGEQLQLLNFLKLRMDAQVVDDSVQPEIRPVYLLEPFTIMDGQAVVSLATRRFERQGTLP